MVIISFGFKHLIAVKAALDPELSSLIISQHVYVTDWLMLNEINKLSLLL
jgi:hypothetical protein